MTHPRHLCPIPQYAYLPSEVASSIYASIDRVAQARRRADQSKTLDQYRADIYAERLLDETGSGKPRAHVHVYLDFLTVLGLRDNPAFLAGYGHLPYWAVEDIVADPGSTWSRLITDPMTGQLLEAGDNRYRAPASLARFIKARDRECTQPGCHRPADFCEIDHIVTRAQNGPTDHDNCHGYCTIHNLLRNEPGWRAEPNGNGGMTITTPTGRTYTAEPEPLHEPEPDDNPPPF